MECKRKFNTEDELSSSKEDYVDKIRIFGIRSYQHIFTVISLIVQTIINQIRYFKIQRVTYLNLINQKKGGQIMIV